MTNYSERLDEIIRKLCHDFENRKVDSLQAQVDAKADITSLIKELVAEAKPLYNNKISRTYFQANSYGPKAHKNGYRLGVREFEKNLLKALEEEKK